MKILLMLLLLVSACWADPPSHDIEVLHNEVGAALSKKDYPTANAKALKALDIAEKAFGKLDQRNLLCLEKLYDVQIAASDGKGAELSRRKMLAIMQATYGANSPEMNNERQRFANFLAQQGRWPECNQLYHQVIDFYSRDSSGRYRESLIGAMQDFVQILQAQNKNDEAAVWDKKAKEMAKNITR